MRSTSLKTLAAACLATDALVAASPTPSVQARDGATELLAAPAVRPPTSGSLAPGTREAPQALRQELQELQASHKVGQLTARQGREAEQAARNVFATTHPQLAT